MVIFYRTGNSGFWYFKTLPAENRRWKEKGRLMKRLNFTTNSEMSSKYEFKQKLTTKAKKAKKVKSGLWLIIITILLLCGCADVSGKLLIIQGNFHNSRGRHNDAITAYLKTLEHEKAAPYGEYGLGAVYFSMGEEKASLERFSQAGRMLDTFPENINRELRYRIHYNTGVVLFSEGDFSGAAVSFREALRTDGRRLEAKRNLELSIKARDRENTTGNDNRGGNESMNESRAVLLEYMQQREINQWKSQTWQEEEDFSGPDY